MKTRALAITSLLTIALAVPAIAYAADQSGAEGRAKTVEVLSPSSDSYIQYHGRLIVRAQKRDTEYRWGGTSCGSKVLSDAQVDRLVEAVRDKDEVKILPLYQPGQGTNKCLVGFSLRFRERKN